MQAKIIETKTQGFQPITLQLTFETKEELEAFRTITSYEVSIPSFLDRECDAFKNEAEKETAQKVIAKIFQAIPY